MNFCTSDIELANSRCYVVDLKYRPWDMPRNESIALLNRYCITYESKSKCRLLVTIGVDLIKVPRLARGKTILDKI
jgi:VAD1 Analog of StAR-related lipid transfer domain